MIPQRSLVDSLARISIVVSMLSLAGSMACRPNGAGMADQSQRHEAGLDQAADARNTADESGIISSGVSDFRERWARVTRDGEPAQIDELLVEWKAAEPDNPDIYVSAANYFFHEAVREGGIEISTKPPEGGDAVLRDPKSGKVAGSISTRVNEDDAGRAAQLLREATDKFPFRLDIWMGLAHITKELGDIDAHCAVLEKGLKYAAAHPADLKWTNGDPLPTDPSQFVPEVIQGHLGSLFELGSEGEDHFLKLALIEADLFPNHAYPVNNLAAYYSGKQDWPHALAYLEKAHELAPKDALVMLNLGFVHSQLYNNAKARMYYEQVLASDADQQVLDHARACLAELD